VCVHLPVRSVFNGEKMAAKWSYIGSKLRHPGYLRKQVSLFGRTSPRRGGGRSCVFFVHRCRYPTVCVCLVAGGSLHCYSDLRMLNVNLSSTCICYLFVFVGKEKVFMVTRGLNTVTGTCGGDLWICHAYAPLPGALRVCFLGRGLNV
jgi:hypothetical protein